jgi:hypothetical protein
MSVDNTNNANTAGAKAISQTGISDDNTFLSWKHYYGSLYDSHKNIDSSSCTDAGHLETIGGSAAAASDTSSRSTSQNAVSNVRKTPPGNRAPNDTTAASNDSHKSIEGLHDDAKKNGEQNVDRQRNRRIP